MALLNLTEVIRKIPLERGSAIACSIPGANGRHGFPRLSYFDFNELLVCLKELNISAVRYFIDQGGSLDYVRLGEDLVLVISRDIPADSVNFVYDATGWQALRVRFDGSIEEKFGSDIARVSGTNVSFIDFSNGLQVEFSRKEGPRFPGLSLLFQPSLLSGCGMRPLSELIKEWSESAREIPPPMIAVEPTRELMRLTANAFALDLQLELSRLSARGLAYQLLAVALGSLSTQRRDQKFMPLGNSELLKFSALKKRLDTDFHLNHPIDMLSRSCGMNRRKLNEGFKALYGFTIYDYLLSQRMAHAERLLLEGHRIADIAERVGYKDSSSFSRAYKRLVGSSPGLSKPSESQ